MRSDVTLQSDSGQGSWQSQRPVVAKRRTVHEVIETGGRRRVVERRSTTCSRLYRNKRLTPDLMVVLDAIVRSEAEARGVATRDGDDSTAKLISGVYNGMPTQAHTYGSRTLSKRQLDAGKETAWIKKFVPEEQRDLCEMIISEELGVLEGKPPTLAQFGGQWGYGQKQQASASGGTQIQALLCWLKHFRREYLRMHRNNPDAPRNGPPLALPKK